MSDKWIDAQWIAPGIPVVVCKECGAWVTPAYCETHEQWHERLRQAVDETGTLG
jgi:hypothetical protein